MAVGFKGRITGSEKAVTRPGKQGFPPVAKSGGVSSGRPGIAKTAGPESASRAAQYTAGKSQGGAAVLKEGATKLGPKITKGGASSMGREATSHTERPGTDNNAGEIRHPSSHGAFENLGVPKGGKY